MQTQNQIAPEHQLAVHVLVVFRRAERTIRSSEGAVIKAHGLTPMQFGVLDVLYSKGPLTIGALIETMLSTSGNMTVVVRNMERDGYVCRCVNPEDARSYLIGLTDRGRRKLEEIILEHAAHMAEIFSVLTGQEQRELIHLLRKFKKERLV